jgi:hypothetical protein
VGLTGVLLTQTAVVCVALIAWPWSEKAPPSPLPGDNGMDTSFGTIRSDLHRPSDSGPVDWEARTTIKPGAASDAARFLFALVSQTPTLEVHLLNLTTADGTPIAVDRDEREEGALVPKLFVNASAMPSPGTEIVLRGTAAADNNGRYQVGSLVIAFDADWEKVVTPDGDVAQLYGYGYVSAAGLDGRGPPFEGSGNVAPFGVVAFLFLLPLGGIVGGVEWMRRRPRPDRLPPAAGPPVAAPPTPPPARPAVARRPPREDARSPTGTPPRIGRRAATPGRPSSPARR